MSRATFILRLGSKKEAKSKDRNLALEGSATAMCAPDCWGVKKRNQKVKMKSLSRVQLFATLWTVAYQAPLSIGFSRQEYWSGLPFPSPGHLPNPGVEPGSPTL